MPLALSSFVASGGTIPGSVAAGSQVMIRMIGFKVASNKSRALRREYRGVIESSSSCATRLKWNRTLHHRKIRQADPQPVTKG